MEDALQVGDSIPEFECEDQNQKTVSNRDFEGCPYLLFFFPHDEDVESLKIAQALFARLPDFDELDVMLIGVNSNSASAHHLMMLKHQLFFPMLVDKNRDLCRQCQVLAGEKIETALFLVDSEGVIRWIEKPVKSDGVAERVLEALELNFA